MSLIVLSVVVIALLIAVLAIYLFITGVLLNRTADNLDDCLHSVKTISMQANVIGPGVIRINKIGTDLVGALPLLYGGAERLLNKPAPSSVGYLDASETTEQHGAHAAPSGTVGYMDMDAATPERAEQPGTHAAIPVRVGYMDS